MRTSRETLRLTRDVPGVVGSFLLDGAGRVVARDLPPSVDDGVVTALGRRCGAALDAVRIPMPGSDQVVLRFARLAVVTGQAGDHLLVVLAEATAQTSVVRIATRATAIRLAAGSHTGQSHRAAPPDPTAEPAAAPDAPDREVEAGPADEPAAAPPAARPPGRRPRRGRGVWR